MHYYVVTSLSYFVLCSANAAMDEMTEAGKCLFINEKALKCKPPALIFGRGRAKELLHVRDDLRKRTR